MLEWVMHYRSELTLAAIGSGFAIHRTPPK